MAVTPYLKKKRFYCDIQNVIKANICTLRGVFPSRVIRGVYTVVEDYLHYYYNCYDHHHYFFHTHLLSSFWTGRRHRCRPFSVPGLAFYFHRAWGLAIPVLVDFSSSVANSRSRAFRRSICAQEKKISTNLYEYALTNLYEYALSGARTQETDLYQARG